MGELLLCNRSIAAMPYFIEELSLNIYSLEELCYVIEHHPYLMEEGFFDEALILWIEREIGEIELAEQLSQSKEEEAGIIKLVEQILNATGYLNYTTALSVVSRIREIQHKSVFERRKIRADHYVQNKKYIHALLEYRKILQMEEECRKNPFVCGNIWHNQGIAYARLFLFKEAKECFETAYKYHMNMESIYEAMLLYKCLGDEAGLRRLAKKYSVDEQERKRLEVYFTERMTGQELKIPIEDNDAVMQMLKEWKREYQ